MPSLYNESTGMIETLSERYEREFQEYLKLGFIELPTVLINSVDGYVVSNEGDLNDISS